MDKNDAISSRNKFLEISLSATLNFSKKMGASTNSFWQSALCMIYLEVFTRMLVNKFNDIKRRDRMILSVSGVLAAILVGTGCTQTTLTAPQRSATEQLLLSTAADRAVATNNLSLFDGKKVFVDGSLFDAYDGKYALGTIRDALNRAGASLVGNITNSDIIVEARSGALSIDQADLLIGVPSAGLPVPLAGTVSIPELAFYKSQKQFSLAKFALLAYETHGGKHFYSSGPLIGRAYNHYYRFIGFIAYTSTDIPAKHRPTATK